MQLIIVESPTKAKTLSRFLAKDFLVLATMGHIKDLPKSQLGVDLKKDFKPEYVFVEKRAESVEAIKKGAKKAKAIFLATDPDREGEAIAQHAKEILLEAKLVKGKDLSRIVFHEITPGAVEEAIGRPRKVNQDLVEAQIARRVLDRLVGYQLSPLLWKKIRVGLSAGRVQTVALRLIVEREKEIKAFKAEEYWEILAEVKKENGKKEDQFLIQLIKVKDKKAEIKNKKQVQGIVKDLEKAKYQVLEVKKKEVKKSPYPPFTTSTMTQAGARIFGWSAKRTMSIAQRLYEKGLITYHRTDSVHLAQTAVEKARGYIQKEFGQEYLPDQARFYKTKSKSAQEAHEAIRPTKIDHREIQVKGKFQADLEKLYGLIWKRFVACQMSSSVSDQTTIDVQAGKDYLLRVSGQVIKFDGWRKLFKHNSKQLEEIVLPEVVQGEKLDLIKVNSEQKFTQPPARFNEASLIKTLEQLGIGRPSTYAPIISTILYRQYVEKDEGKFVPTPVGVAVTDFLVKNFPDLFDYQFTAEMEDDLDQIAQAKKKRTTILKAFWNPFQKKLKKVEEKSKRVKIETEKLGKKCPRCKKGELVVRIGRFGKFISCSKFPDCDYTEKYLEKLGMKCPDCKKGDVIVKKTRKGKKFFGCSNYPECKWASWKNPELKTKNSD